MFLSIPHQNINVKFIFKKLINRGFAPRLRFFSDRSPCFWVVDPQEHIKYTLKICECQIYFAEIFQKGKFC